MQDQLNNEPSPQLPSSQAHKQGHAHQSRNTIGKTIPQNFNIPFLKDQLSYKAQKDITWLRKRRGNRLLVLIICIVLSNIIIMGLIGRGILTYEGNTAIISFVSESVLQLFWLCLVVVKFLFDEKSMK